MWREEWHRGRGGARLLSGDAGTGGNDIDSQRQMTRCGRERSKKKREWKMRSDDEDIIVVMVRDRV